MSQFPRELVIPGPNGLPVGAVASPCKRIYTTEDGAPCCGCEFVYLLELCNPTCAPEYRFKHICGNTQCPATGPYQGPLVPGTVIKQGNRCYRLNDPTKYCPPGLTCHHPNYPPLPVRTTAITGVFTCRSDCSPAACPPLQGFYQLWTCSCTGASQPTIYYVTCELYEQWLAQMNCPVWLADVCMFVPPGEAPVAVRPPGSITLATPPLHDGCCKCCGTHGGFGGECCVCLTDSVLVRYINGEVIETRIPTPCYSWRNTGAVVGCGYELGRGFFGCGPWPVYLDLWQMFGGTTLRHTRWDFVACTLGPTVGGCGASVTSAIANTFTEEFEIGRCEPPPVVPAPPTGGGNPLCPPNGQHFQSCISSSINLVQPGAQLDPPCNGFEVTRFGNFDRTVSGGCGSECAPGSGLVLLDGSPADTIGTISRGCTGCVSEQATSRF